jgi:drug/metabolite transporter (DMT)-like permease
MDVSTRQRLLGVAFALITVLLWAGWISATRFGVTGALQSPDLALFRFAVPAVLLAPVLLRCGFGLDRPWPLAAMVFGAGAPFFMLVSTGAMFAPAAHLAALAPGTLPLWTAILLFVVAGERFDRMRLLGLFGIVLGVLALGGGAALTSTHGKWRGDLLFMAGGMSWAVFTLGFRRSGFGVWHSAALVSFWSLVLFLPFYLLAYTPRLAQASLFELGVQFVGQGLVSGVAALGTYSLGVRYLGSSRAAGIGALTPAVATLLAIPLLDEWPTPVAWTGVVIISLGVALASGTFSRAPDTKPA